MSSYLSIISFYLLALGLFLFPLLYLPILSDPFILPKQAVIFVVTFIGLILWGLTMLVERKVTINVSPLMLPLGLFFAVVLISGLIPLLQSGGNVSLPLVAAYPILSLVLLYVLMIGSVKQGGEPLLRFALFAGATVSALVVILSFFHIYPLPFPQTQVPAFNTMGNLFQSLLFFAVLLPAIVLGALVSYRKRGVALVGFLVAAAALAVAGILIVYQLFVSPPSGQTPIFLPQTIGLQTGTGAIGQNFQSLLLGSGPGTYLSDFTRFKGQEANQLPSWNLRFLSSSSQLLEILATMGLLGLLTFIFIAYRFVTSAVAKGENKDELWGLFLSVALLFIASALFPFTFPVLALLFILLALYSIASGKISDITLHVVALGKTASQNILPPVIFVLFLIVSVFSLYFSGVYLIADYRFQNALVSATQGKITETYNNQREAINLFPYKDAYLRSFSQTSLVLASLIVEKGPDALTDADKGTVINLVQQSIASARSAVALYPLNVFNWENLAVIYRSLIGFGEGADRFAIASAQQAIRLDPANPQLYLFLGGIYYQLTQWDNALTQFQIAVNLKPDFANAYYNVGHALENKGDLRGALAQYRIVQNLIVALPEKAPLKEEDKKKIDEEIRILTERIGKEEAETAAKIKPTTKTQPPLEISIPSATLPPQRPPVQIPQPPTSN